MPRLKVALPCLALGLMLAAPAAEAASFCLKLQGQQPQCLYDDAAECRRRATQLNGLCTANPDMLSITATNGQFCLVASAGGVICAWQDRASCDKEAVKKNGVCIDSTVQGVQPDLHRDMPGRLY